MKHKILAPRRIVTAILLTAFLASGSVLALGERAADSLGEVPETWGVAEPRIGDRGNYTLSVVDAQTGKALAPDVPYYAFEQRPAHTERDARGDAVLVNTIRVLSGFYMPEVWDDEESPLTWQVSSAQEEHVAVNGSVPFTDLDFSVLLQALGREGGNTSVGPVPVLRTETVADGAYRMRSHGATLFTQTLAQRPVGSSLCGLRSSLQGQELAMAGNFELFANCGLRFDGVDPTRLHGQRQDLQLIEAEFSYVPYDAVFRPLGVQRLGSVDALLLAGKHIDRDMWPFDEEKMTAEGLRVWMAREVPYPVQMSYDDGDQVLVLRLTSFQRGNAPLATGSPDPLAPLPALRFAPAKAWGMDDAGSKLAVPASVAWQAALDDGPLASYLASHPDAVTYASWGRLTRNSFDGTKDVEWSFELTDGLEPFGILVKSSVRPLAPVPPLLGLPVTSPDQAPTHSFSTSVPEHAPPLNRSWMPERVPTVQSLLARWPGYAAVNPEVATWGHEAICADSMLPELLFGNFWFSDCEEFLLMPMLGMQDYAMAPDVSRAPTLGLQSSINVHLASFNEDGTVRDQVDLTATGTTNYAAAPLAPTTATAPYEPGPPMHDWVVPDLAVVAGVGFLAVLAGLAYLLWPLAKGGALGLFSRVTGQQVLEHPQRQKLLAAIEAQPGVHLKELARQTGLAWGQTQHHMRKLVDAGAVVAKPLGGYTCYFPKGQDRNVMGAAAVLKADGARRLLAAIATTTGLSMGQLSRAVGLTESTAHYHLKRLEAAGLVTTHLLDGARRVTLTALGSQAGRVYGAAASTASGAAA